VRVRLGWALQQQPRFRIRVTLGFLSAAVLAACAGREPAPLVIGVLFGVALAPELARALVAQLSGRASSVTLDAWGGRTKVLGTALSPALSVSLALVGSGVSLAIGVAHLLSAHMISNVALAALLAQAGRLHVFWGVAHLLPFLPFELGSLLASHLGAWARVKHAVTSLAFALAVVGTIAARLSSPLVFTAVMLLLASCTRSLLESIAAARDKHLEPRQRLNEIEALTLSGDAETAVTLAQRLSSAARSGSLRRKAQRALAWAAIGEQNLAVLEQALAGLPKTSIDLHLFASYLVTGNRSSEAIELLEHAVQHGVRSTETTKLLADLYFRERRFDRVRELAASSSALLSPTDLERIESALAATSAPA
jgi:hypothetical protein